jgi:peptidoglycan hydrolase CwlO-like protein
MANLGKKILSAFVEVSDDKKPVAEKPPSTEYMPKAVPEPLPTFTSTTVNNSYASSANSKFAAYFEKLFSEANIPGPDYFEFSKMIEVMQAVPDEHVRYITAFAGLSVQGLDKQKLLSTAAQYLQLLDTDATNFHSSVDAALQEKVVEKKKGMAEKDTRIQQLTQEISALQNELLNLQSEIKENEAKIEANTGGYKYESEAMKTRITRDIEKIKRYIQ